MVCFLLGLSMRCLQDEWVQQGVRVSPKGNTEVWARRLSNGDTAVGLYNKNGGNNGAFTQSAELG